MRQVAISPFVFRGDKEDIILQIVWRTKALFDHLHSIALAAPDWKLLGGERPVFAIDHAKPQAENR